MTKIDDIVYATEKTAAFARMLRRCLPENKEYLQKELVELAIKAAEMCKQYEKEEQ